VFTCASTKAMMIVMNKKAAPIVEATQIQLSSVANIRSAIMVNISVVIALFNNNGFVAVPMITVADDVTIAVPVTISVTLSNRYANRTNTDPDLFGSSRHCAANPSYSGDYYGILNHCVLLSLLNFRKAIPGRHDRSRLRVCYRPSAKMLCRPAIIVPKMPDFSYR
jgi:hypothetical protein